MKATAEVSYQTWVTVTSLGRLATQDARFGGFAIDSPQAGSRYRGAGLEINGWAIGRDAPVQAIRVRTNGEPGAAHPLDVLRPDVAADYPSFPHAGASGFSLWVPLDLTNPDVSLAVEAVLASGEPAALASIEARATIEESTIQPGARVIAAPDFVIIGAQRGGTTSLHAYLGAHPRVTAPPTKELHFLTDRHHRGSEWYLGEFPPVPAGNLTGEATPYALFHPLAPARLHAAAPHAKSIVLLRNPVDRAYSHYLMERARGDEPLDFAAALEAEPLRLAGEEARLLADPSATSWAHKHASYLARGDYALQLTRWLSFFPRDQMLILRSEDFYTHTAETFAAVSAFLGIEPTAAFPFEVHNRNAGPPIDPHLRGRLAAHFAPRNAELGEMLGWDAGWT